MIGLLGFVGGESHLRRWILGFLLWPLASALAQEEKTGHTDLPFRRVFVPQNDLRAIGVDDFQPIDIKLLDDLLRKHAASRQAELAKQSESDINEGLQLQSAFYVAKLIGADLVSERSHLAFVGDNRYGDRVLLAPWSLAVQPSMANGTKQESQSSPVWTFNERGEPRLTASFESNLRSETKAGRFESTFGWSAKAESTSSPNKLKFSLEVPSCVDCCLVLALPPQAEIQDSLTVVQRVSDWSQVDRRLSSWSDFAKEARREASTGLASESLWLIELGGSQTASFSISLGSDNRTQNAKTDLEKRRYDQLVRSQTIQHFIEGQEIRTLCDAEISVSQEQPRLRLSLESRARVRRLTVNQVDVDWKVEDGWIDFVAPAATLDTNSSNFANVVAEFISSFEEGDIRSIEAIHPSFDRSYVMSGSTILHSALPWRLTHIHCESSRMVPPLEETKSSGVNRIEYSWSAHPPKLALGLERTIPTRRCEVLSRLSNDELGTTANIRAKLVFSEQDSNQTKVEILKGWKLISLSSMDPNDAVSIQAEIETPSGREFQLTWDRIQRNRVADIELHLFREAEEAVGKLRQIDCQSIFRLPGWQRSDTLVAEQDEIFQLDARDSLLDRMISEDLVSDWQKPLLPKSIKGNLFRLESPFVAQQLIWKKNLATHLASIRTEIEGFGLTTIRARHEIQLNMTSKRTEPLAIALPGLPAKDVFWRWKEKDQWVPLTPLATSPALTPGGSGLWLFDIRTLGLQPMLLAVVNSEIQEGNEVTFPIPKLIDFEMVSQVAQSLSRDIMLDSDQKSVWKINDSGYKILELPTESGEASLRLTAKALISTHAKKWFVDSGELHVAVDAVGTQKASLTLHANAMAQSPVAIELEDGWKPLNAKIQYAERNVELPIRLDGQRLVIPRQQLGTEGSVSIEFVGPRLQKEGFLSLSQSYTFRWPVFTVDGECVAKKEYLWLPAELQLNSIANHSLDDDSSWPLWGWSRKVLDTVYGFAAVDSNVSLSNFPAMPIIAPNWDSVDWRLALRGSNQSESRSDPNDYASMGQWSIVPATPNRTLLTLFFGLVVLFTPHLMRMRNHIATGVCFCLIALAHFAPSVVSRFAFTGLVAMFLGFLGAILFELLKKRLSNEASHSQKNSAKWSPWNDRQSENESGSNHLVGRAAVGTRSPATKLGSLCLFFVACNFLTNQSSPFGSMALGQSKAGDEKAGVYQILLPIDDAGELVGTTAYVPQPLLDGLTGKTERSRLAERGTFAVSARYSLRAGLRGRFNSGDQITMAYEFMVGDDLAPVRFPSNGTQLLLPRFIIDGVETGLGNRLRSNGTYWTWTPDRPGRKTVQIIAQPDLKQIGADRSKDVQSQLLDIAIIPVANATIEIQTDLKNGVDVVSRGRVTDPEGGRFVAMLGAVDRLNCNIRTSSTKSNTSSTTVPENGEAPTMHTELFLQNDILQAKTIVDFPRSHSFGAQVEIEADLQWLPVGSQWGDAQLVDIRAGSNLFRQRYVLEWKTPSSGASSLASPLRERQISVIWVPQTTTQSLNVLFAECLERGTRRGTLRFARSFPSWNIEGISTWIPAIGSKERLDWPELKTNPRALSLRIPPNGGFGLLKPKAIADKPQQSRITTKLSVEQNRESLSSMIAWFGSSPSSEPLIVELPDDYQVSELYNRSGPIRFLQNKVGGKNKLQILSDRNSLEASDLWIQARRQTEPEEHTNDSSWRSLPWIELPTNVYSDQSLEIQASERVALSFESEQPPINGRGLNIPLQNLQRSSSDSLSSSTAASRFKVIHRDDPLTGNLQLKLDSNSSSKELEVKAHLFCSETSRPFFVLEVPYSYRDRWQSEARIISVPCPDENRAWLQVYLPEQTSTNISLPVSMKVRFSLRSEDTASVSDISTRFRALDCERIPTQLLHSEPESEKSNGEASDVKKPSGTALDSSLRMQPTIGMTLFHVSDENFMPTPTKRFLLLESQYWLTEKSAEPSRNNELEWQLGDGVEALSVEVDNKPVPFRQEGDILRCAWIPTGLCSDVRIFSKHEVREKGTNKVSVKVPLLTSFVHPSSPILLRDAEQQRKRMVSVLLDDVAIPSIDRAEAIGIIALTCLDMVEESKRSWPKLDRVESGSDFEIWKNHWSEKSRMYLRDWASYGAPKDQSAYGAAVERWHSLRLFTQTQPERPVAETSPFGRQAHRSQPSSPWYSFVGCLLILGSVTWLTTWIGLLLSERPWWSYLILGLVAWLVTGSLLPTLVLGTIGLVVAVDCYWMITSRLRRSELRGLR